MGLPLTLDLTGATAGPLPSARAPQWVSVAPSSGPVTVPLAGAHAHGDGGGDDGEKTG